MEHKEKERRYNGLTEDEVNERLDFDITASVQEWYIDGGDLISSSIAVVKQAGKEVVLTHDYVIELEKRLRRKSGVFKNG